MNLDWSRRDVRGGKTVLTTIDAHAAGEPLRIVTGGLPEIPGRTILERRRWMRENLDHLRRALIWEPRGHFDQYGCVIVPPVTPGADLGVLFLHNEGYSTMCGHGIIAVVTALLETGAIESRGTETPVAIDTPAGLVRAVAHRTADARVERVSFRNVPSFVERRDVSLDVAGFDRVTFDIAFGGAYYAILPAASLGRPLSNEAIPFFKAAARAIKAEVARHIPIEHPTDPDLGFLYGVIFTDAPENVTHHSRNLCVFAADEVDRSPTGTGVSARVALHFARGEIALGQEIAIESILGSRSVFTGRVVEETSFGSRPAVVPEVSGQAYLTGRHEFFLDPNDPLVSGFLL